MTFKINPNPPFFTGYIQPNGYLDTSREAHGLWNYYLCARNAYETHIHESAIIFEDQKNPITNLRQLFTSMAEMYGVQPEAMAQCWDMVDKQCEYLELPRLPDHEQYRFNRTPVIITRH